MDRGLAAKHGLECWDTADVIGMSVSQQDALTAQPTFVQQCERLRELQSRVDHQRVGGVAAAEHVAVLIERGIDDDCQFDEVAERVGHDRKTRRGRR